MFSLCKARHKNVYVLFLDFNFYGFFFLKTGDQFWLNFGVPRLQCLLPLAACSVLYI